MKNIGNSSRGRRSQGVPKIFRAPMYNAHCAVIFAIALAQLSCLQVATAKLHSSYKATRVRLGCMHACLRLRQWHRPSACRCHHVGSLGCSLLIGA